MWREACRYFDAHRSTLAAAGLPLRARLQQSHGLLCCYADGVVHLALPDPERPEGALQAELLAAVMQLPVSQVVWLFRTQLSRLVAHEIGHALRAEAGSVDADPWKEEQAAERIACLLSRPHLLGPTRDQLVALLRPVATRLGGLPQALACHRLGERARQRLGLEALPHAAPPTAAEYRDFSTFLRICVAWSYVDLSLDPEDDLDAIRNDLLLAG